MDLTDSELLLLNRPRFKLHPGDMDLKALRLPPLGDKDKGQKVQKGGVRVAFWTLGGRGIVASVSQPEVDAALEGTVENFTQSECPSDPPLLLLLLLLLLVAFVNPKS